MNSAKSVTVMSAWGVYQTLCLLAWAALCIGLGPSAQAQTVLQDAAHDLTTKLNQDPDVAKISGQRLVITQFRNITGSGDAAPQLLQAMLTTEFIDAKHLKVVERSQLQKALEELKFGMSDLVDTDKARQVGKLVGATYILLGEMGQVDNSSTYISARLVSIETGESVAAKSTTVKMDAGATPAAPAVEAAPTTNTADPATAPAVPGRPAGPGLDLSTKATSASAGTWEGTKPDLGLLGGSVFKIAWKENLGTDPVYSFASGDAKGNKISYLVVKEVISGGDEIAVLRWEGGKFKRLWHNSAYVSPHDSMFIGPGIVTDVGQGYFWKWDGTTFQPGANQPFFEYPGHGIVSTIEGAGSEAVGITGNYGNYVFYGPFNWASLSFEPETARKMLGVSSEGDFLWVTAGDYDGDGKAEFALSHSLSLPGNGKPIAIVGQDGHRKGITEVGYGDRVCTWRPTHTMNPFIVATRTEADENHSPAGGYCYFIRWDGETYEEAWKSIRLDDEVLDFHICDPKNEGQDGLVVLSKDSKNFYLTKIVLAH